MHLDLLPDIWMRYWISSDLSPIFWVSFNFCFMKYYEKQKQTPRPCFRAL